MKSAIYKDGQFTGHIGNSKNMDSLAKVIARKNPRSRVEVRAAMDQTASYATITGK